MLKLISSTNISHTFFLSSRVSWNADDGTFLLNPYHIVAVREVSVHASLSVLRRVHGSQNRSGEFLTGKIPDECVCGVCVPKR